MADKYDSNGEYAAGYTGGDFKRKSAEGEKRSQDMDDHRERDRDHERDRDREHTNDEDADETHIAGASHKVNEYMSELLAEKQLIDPHKFHNAARLIDQEITKVQAMNRVPAREHKYVDIYRERPIKVSAKVLVPVREHPKFNFVGKLLGPKGNSMKRLQEETMCKMAVLGRGSMKDRAKEEELRASCDPKYAHLSDDLHVEISALGPPAEAHARVAFALAEVRKYLVPDNNDNIRQEQMREMDIIGGGVEEVITGPVYRGVRRGGGGGHLGSVRGEYSRSAPGTVIPMRTATRTPVHHHSHHSHHAIAPPSHHIPAQSMSSAAARGVMPAKTKILSILDRARIAMEESYGGGGAGGGAPGYGEEVVMTAGGYETMVVGDHVGYETGYSPVQSAGGVVRGGRGGEYDGAEYDGGDYYGGGSRGDSSSYESSARWKSSYKPSSGGSASRHLDSASTRYRSSPYSRPPK